ncbi:DUF932 domain-containing protein [Pokkaliibacter sp. MBI-7]|uniref:DUF932 domain-containing protein n=1 Tax=Pokkaliibacter sp. MBI-7 TaxID=3040600 RepID=UPI00244ACBA9|nr:DUF932 domain-containing protein [Pokkaliibacter sp. MBI-7]MDH2436848.1 DUF932 domain-containing protein [Pokkaliibacter sp. MBI-7]
MQLVSNFRSINGTRSDRPLSDDQIMRVAPSIFATEPHESRSDRYTYIPTIQVLDALRKEGFAPFMVCQTRVRNLEKKDHTKHMIRLRHANQINGKEANEIILLNSHDGTSSYQMLAGMFRFVCHNGMVCGDTLGDIRVRHQGDVISDVIEGAYTVLDSFEAAEEQREGMKALTLNDGEQAAFARAALTLKYDNPEQRPAPITEDQILSARRYEDRSNDLWGTFNRVQENMLKGGLNGRNRNGRRQRTRAVTGIDQNVKLNRALWVLADEMKRLKA